MIVLILVAVLWIAVLVPTVISKWNERRSAGSIGRFHHRLDLLERTGPKLVEPAYRLTGTESASSSSAPLIVPVSPPPVRPVLRLVPSADVWAVGAVGADSEFPLPFEEEMVELQPEWHGAENAVTEHREHRPAEMVDRDRQQTARRRRRDVFGILCALTAITGLIGLAHPLRGAWVVSCIFLVLLVAFVGLAIYGQHIEAERRHWAGLGRRERVRMQDEDRPSSMITYVSDDELTLYRDALAEYYEAEDDRLTAQG